MESLPLKREQERKAWEAKSQELQTKNDKLMKQVTCQSSVQGAKHIIWDAIIEEAIKLRPYLVYVLNKEAVVQSSKQIVTSTKEKLNKNPIDYANNAINFLNGLKEDELNTSNNKDRISIITQARKVANKYRHLDTVQAEIDIMAHQLKIFRDMFDPLFKKGIALFCEDKGTMLIEEEYQDKLIQCRLDHTIFADMHKS